ncbi:hypothetical protein C8R44DRAFT_808376, partial [Mycena epipterygia]
MTDDSPVSPTTPDILTSHTTTSDTRLVSPTTTPDTLTTSHPPPPLTPMTAPSRMTLSSTTSSAQPPMTTPSRAQPPLTSLPTISRAQRPTTAPSRAQPPLTPSPTTSRAQPPTTASSRAQTLLTPSRTTTLETLVSPTTTPNTSGKGTIAGSIVAGIVALVGIAGILALTNWAHQVNQAKKVKKFVFFISRTEFHEFNFLLPFPPHLPRPKKKMVGSFQITLTLTPVDIEEDHTYQQVVWQRFNINDGSREFTARLDYDRAFGTANIRDGSDNINRVSFSDRPLSIGHAKPGRPVPLEGSAWANPLDFIVRKYTRIIARNESRVPVRVVIGSYICEGSEGSSTESSEHDLEEGNVEGEEEEDRLCRPKLKQQVGFQSFVVFDNEIGHEEELSASFDLILRAYKTHDVEVAQILSPAYLRDKAVPLLEDQGIRVSKLPKSATWYIIMNGSDVQLTVERPTWR